MKGRSLILSHNLRSLNPCYDQKDYHRSGANEFDEIAREDHEGDPRQDGSRTPIGKNVLGQEPWSDRCCNIRE